MGFFFSGKLSVGNGQGKTGSVLLLCRIRSGATKRHPPAAGI